MLFEVAERHARPEKSRSTTLGRRVDIAAAAGGSLDDQPLGHQVGVFDKC